jgi:putative SOS response-associated peptidase YedK
MKDDSPFVFAGLWEGWKIRRNSEWLRTCTIVTGGPNELVAAVHTRMPVIVSEEHHAKWLGGLEDGDLKEMLKPFPISICESEKLDILGVIDFHSYLRRNFHVGEPAKPTVPAGPR